MMKVLIIPSVRMKSGTGIRLYGIADSLRKHGFRVEIAETRKQKFFSKADVVFASKSLIGSCIPSMFRKIFGRSLLILDIDDLEWGYWQNNMVMKGLMKFSDKFFPKYFDAITTHTEELRKYITWELKVPEEKIIFLPQGIDFSMFSRITWKPTKPRKIVYAAHLGVAAMDVDIILRVFRNVVAKENDVRLQIIGSGTYLEHFKDMAKKMGIEDSVDFLGYVDHSKIPKIISQASVAVNYLRDNLANKYRSSIKVREYLAVGVPTVCNVIGDISLFSKYVYGFRAGNLKDFENKILKALENPNREMCRKGREFVKENWQWEQVTLEFERKVKMLCGKNM
jgi:glycosyltransferase involved in cell wall biosynthesis